MTTTTKKNCLVQGCANVASFNPDKPEGEPLLCVRHMELRDKNFSNSGITVWLMVPSENGPMAEGLTIFDSLEPGWYVVNAEENKSGYQTWTFFGDHDFSRSAADHSMWSTGYFPDERLVYLAPKKWGRKRPNVRLF